ncbi:DUF6706 family protein [Joostella sp.]|uniref:DUF6706 family protein n=1 Tax=Joostella sp. TaxID=2231138 RepID=UPI003A8C9A44
MTVFEAIKANPIFASIPNDTIEATFLNRGYDSSEEYLGTDEQKKEVALVSADLYVQMALQPSWKEGQLSVTYDNDLLISRAIAIYGKYDDPAGDGLGDRDVSPTISDASDYA